MITEDYVSFEIAKLLKEKGFGEDCHAYWDLTTETKTPIIGLSVSLKNWNYKWNPIQFPISAPTLQMAMKWLREVHHIEISITFGFSFIDGKQQYKYFWSIVKVCNNHLEYPMDDPNNVDYSEEMADSYEEACEAAIEYCLENLI